MKSPLLISVLIGIHNGENYIKETVASILTQTYSDFEIIAVVNCTDDATIQILKDFNDTRIKIYETDICQLAFNLNYGLQVAQGEYIARIDADDVARDDRLEKQLQCFKENDYDIIGSNITLIDENSHIIGEKKYPQTNTQIRKKIYYSNPFAHPSVMFKKKVVMQVGGYQNGRMSEDYDLWIRLMRDENVKFHNIQESLIMYRIHSNQARGNKLAYAEIAGYFVREAIYLKKIIPFFASLVYLFKALVK